MGRTVLLLALVGVVAACAEPATRSDMVTPSLDGTYETSIPAAAFKGTELPRYLGGEWTLEIRDGQYVITGEKFRVVEDLAVEDEDTVTISAVPAPLGAYNCFEAGERLLPPTKVEATYAYKLEDGLLAFQADRELCDYRDILLEREWSVAN